jgi:hypothetical protein
MFSLKNVASRFGWNLYCILYIVYLFYKLSRSLELQVYRTDPLGFIGRV